MAVAGPADTPAAATAGRPQRSWRSSVVAIVYRRARNVSAAELKASWRVIREGLPKEMRAGHSATHTQRTVGHAVHVVAAKLVHSRSREYFVQAGVFLSDVRAAIGAEPRTKPQTFECQVCWQAELLAGEPARTFTPGDEATVVRVLRIALERLAPIRDASTLTDPELLATPERRATSNSGPFPLDAQLAFTQGARADAYARLVAESTRTGRGVRELAELAGLVALLRDPAR